MIDRRVATWAFLLPVMVGCASAPSATEPTSASPEPTILTLGREEQPLHEQGNFVDCDAAGDGRHYFESWTGNGWATDRYHEGRGQVDRLWILDIDGARLVIDAFYVPSATSEDRDELLDVVESIRFER